MSRPVRVAVVGAGVTGLVAGYRILQGARASGLALELAVLEAEPRAGGHLWTTRHEGFLVEGGPNGFLHRPREPHTLELARDLGIAARVIEALPAARRRYVLVRGRLERAPDSPPALLASGALSPAGRLRLLLEPWARRAPAGVEESVHEFARRRVGAEAAEIVDAAVAGLTAGDGRRLSAAAAFPAMVDLEREHGSLIRGFMARRREGPSRLLSFDGGMETLLAALRDRLGRALRTGFAVERIARAEGEWRVWSGSGESRAADRVVLAVSAARAAPLLAAHDPPVAAVLAGFPSAGLAVVALAYREADLARPLDGYGYLVTAREGLDTLGVVWESSLFPGRAPAGCVLLRAMLGGARRPDLPGLDADELARRARRELAAVMGISAPPLRTWVRRWPNAITQYEVGHRRRVEQARELAARHPGLELCGTSYDGVSIGGAVTSAERAAARLLADLASRSPASAGVPPVPLEA